MKVNYDKDLLIAGIGLVPWTRLGPDIWFDKYKIVSKDGWGIDDSSAPTVLALSDTTSQVVLPKQNTQALIENPDFQSIITGNLAGYHLLTYKPVVAPKTLKDAGIRFVHGTVELARELEDKAMFRTQFCNRGISFPAFDIYDKQALSPTQADLTMLLKGRQSVILQDSVLSGGKGTFVVESVATLQKALAAISTEPGRIVVSERIQASFERTVQCVVTKYGTFVGPLQKQIVNDPLLANVGAEGSDRFCGAEISPYDICASSYDTIKNQALTIGQELFERGYRGIFGMDCLVTEPGEVFILEINPRITGVTPLITMLQGESQGIPFYLLHILELMKADYTIEDIDSTHSTAEGALMMLHAQTNQLSTVKTMPASGVYDQDLNRLSGATRFGHYEKERYIVQRYHTVGARIKPGDRLLSVLTNRRILNDDDTLNDATRKNVNELYGMVGLENI